MEKEASDDDSFELIDLGEFLNPHIPNVTVGDIAWGFWNDGYWPMVVEKEADKDRFWASIFHPRHCSLRLKIRKKKFEPFGFYKHDQKCLKGSARAKLLNDIQKARELASCYRVEKTKIPDLTPQDYLDVCNKSVFLEFSIDIYKVMKRGNRERSTSPEMCGFVDRLDGRISVTSKDSKPQGAPLNSIADSVAEEQEIKVMNSFERLREEFPLTHASVVEFHEKMLGLVQSEDTLSELKKRLEEARDLGEDDPRGVRRCLWERRFTQERFRRLRSVEMSGLGTLGYDLAMYNTIFKNLLDSGPWIPEDSYPFQRDYLTFVAIPEFIVLTLQKTFDFSYEEADRIRIQGVFHFTHPEESEKYEKNENLEFEDERRNRKRRRRSESPDA